MKQEFIDSLRLLPEDIQAFLTTTIGTFTPIEMPTDAEEAVIAMGKANAQIINHIFVPYSGLNLVELILRVGQLHPGVGSMVLSNLEYVGPPQSGWGIQFLFPAEGQVFHYEGETTFIVHADEAQHLQGLMVTIEGEGSITMSETDTEGEYIGMMDLPANVPTLATWSLTFTAEAKATYQNEDDSNTTIIKTASVTFSIDSGGGE